MVYCTKCGFKNEDAVRYCIKCGATLAICERAQVEKRVEEECFGLPHGRAIASAIIGIIIILIGLSLIPSLISWFRGVLWPIIVIVVGALIIGGSLYSYSRR